MKSVLAAAAVVGALLAAPIAHANGSPTTCDGFLSGRVVEGDLVVPAGATCTAGGVRVLGDVTVEQDARFGGDAVIEGDVTIASGGSFNVTDSAVGGDIVCVGCAALGLTFMWDPTFQITSTGKVKVRGATGAYIAIEGWRIASLEVRDSAGTFTFIEFHASRDVVFADNVGNAGFWYVRRAAISRSSATQAAGTGFRPTSRSSATPLGRISSSPTTSGRPISRRTSPRRISSASITTPRPQAGETRPARTSPASVPA